MIYQMIYKTRNSKRCYQSYVDTKEMVSLEDAVNIWKGYGFKEDLTLIGVNIVNKNARRINYLADKCAHDYNTLNKRSGKIRNDIESWMEVK